MVTFPSRMVVTRPLLSTVARLVLLLVQVKLTPVITLLFASYAVAVNWIVLPSFTRGLDGVTTILLIGGVVTVTVAVPDCPSLVAVIVAVPGATPVTTPAADTVATDVALLVQVTTRPVRMFPAASRVVAPNVTLCPAATLAVPGATVTLDTGTWLTLTVADAITPSIVAVITAPPTETPVTSPVDDTVATAGDELDQLTVRPVST